MPTTYLIVGADKAALLAAAEQAGWKPTKNGEGDDLLTDGSSYIQGPNVWEDGGQHYAMLTRYGGNRVESLIDALTETFTVYDEYQQEFYDLI